MLEDKRHFQVLPDKPWITQDVASLMGIAAIQKLRDMKPRPTIRTKIKYLKDMDGNWFRQDNGYALGTGCQEGYDILKGLFEDGDMTFEQIVDNIMVRVNDSLED